MSDRPIGLGKVAENGTLNENGAFYSVQDINVLLENGGGSSGGGDLPTPTVADAGKAVVVDAEGKYALGEAGGGGFIINQTTHNFDYILDKNYNEIEGAFLKGFNPVICQTIEVETQISRKFMHIDAIYESSGTYNVLALNYDMEANIFDKWLFTADSATGTLTSTGPITEG